jgi:5-(carboxyamino)imidazole ribonucleotide mutase
VFSSKPLSNERLFLYPAERGHSCPQELEHQEIWKATAISLQTVAKRTSMSALQFGRYNRGGQECPRSAMRPKATLANLKPCPHPVLGSFFSVIVVKKKQSPLVGVIMGSDSDWPTMKAAAEACREFAVPFEAKVVSAHRTPLDMAEYAQNAAQRGLKVIIAGAGGAAHLPGMVASNTILPVIGVPIQSKVLSGMDSLLSIVQMPQGVPVATVAIGNGRNAGLLAVQILALEDATLQKKLREFKLKLISESRERNKNLTF